MKPGRSAGNRRCDRPSRRADHYRLEFSTEILEPALRALVQELLVPLSGVTSDARVASLEKPRRCVMFRTTIIALAAAAALGTSVASAAPFNVTSIAAAAEENGSLQRVTWYRPQPQLVFVRHRYRHRHSA